MPSDRRRSRGLPDHARPGARVLFVGINPGLRSAAVGHHFAGFSNRFWRLLHESGLVREPLAWRDDARLPELGYGITNLIGRPTRGTDALEAGEYAAGRRTLERKVARLRPGVVALLGVSLYRTLFAAPSDLGHRRAGGKRSGRGRGKGGPVRLGLQRERLAGRPVFLLPNPSGRNAHVPYAAMLAAFRALRRRIR